MEDPMGFERQAIPSAERLVGAKPASTVPRQDASVVKPLHQGEASREMGILRLARQMRGEWRKERYSRLAGN
jgi:hypothetical protein